MTSHNRHGSDGAPPAEPDRPWLIVVSGAPGSGKTTLGLSLSHELHLPYLSRDDVRFGLLATSGLWTNKPGPRPDGEAARASFVKLVEAAAALGISAVLEFIPFRDDHESTRRLAAVANCPGVQLTCVGASERADQRDRSDPLLNRPSVLSALSVESIDSYVSLMTAGRDAVRARMQVVVEFRQLLVRTDDGYDPDFDAIVNWVIDQTRRGSGAPRSEVVSDKLDDPGSTDQ